MPGGWLAGLASAFQTTRALGMCQTRPLRLGERSLGRAGHGQPAPCPSPPVAPCPHSAAQHSPDTRRPDPARPCLGSQGSQLTGDQVCGPAQRKVGGVWGGRLLPAVRERLGHQARCGLWALAGWPTPEVWGARSCGGKCVRTPSAGLRGTKDEARGLSGLQGGRRPVLKREPPRPTSPLPVIFEDIIFSPRALLICLLLKDLRYAPR